MKYYVEREVDGKMETLQILNGHYTTWNGCFCLLNR